MKIFVFCVDATIHGGDGWDTHRALLTRGNYREFPEVTRQNRGSIELANHKP